MKAGFRVQVSGFRFREGRRRAIRDHCARRFCALIVVGGLFCFPNAGKADSARSLVKQGNAAYSLKKYDEALAAYEKAGVDLPESPYIYYNKGTVYYRQQDYAKAKEAFAAAAQKSKDLKLEAGSKFNLGNCAFRESERQRDSDLEKSFAACEESIRHYQEALKLDPQLKEAAENIEIVRLLMKTIMDEINKKKEELAKQQEARKNAAETLKELIRKQEEITKDNQSLTAERNQKGDSPDITNKISSIADRQENLQKETETTAQGLPPSQDKQQTSPDKAREHLNKAVNAQASAAGKLDARDTEGAAPDQKKSEDELKNALAALSEPSGGQQGKQEQQEKKEGEQSGESQGASDKKQEPEKEDQPVAQLSDEAQDILDEEKENQEQRRPSMREGYREVDKDW